MKKNKKILFILAIAIISATMLSTLQATAVSDAKIDLMEYSSRDIPKEKLEQIIKAMYGVDGETEPSRNLLCIFGHSKTTGKITITDHNYYSTAPKCRQTISYVEYCTRSGCDYFTTLSQSVSRITCH